MLLACAVCVVTSCTPPVPGGNDNTADNLNDNGPGQDNPGQVVVTIVGDGTVDQVVIGDGFVRLTATPNSGWGFEGWSGDVNSSENPITVHPETDMAVTATFVELSPVDSDFDGVFDAEDRCPSTIAGLPVDGAGCAEYQRDTDGDGLTDDIDLCPGTPAGMPVDAVGCAADEQDADNDGVDNDLDQCPQTPAGSAVNAAGCAASQLDSDNDGVADDADNCPNTPAGTAVDSNGCPVIAGCIGATGNCFVVHPTAGCSDPSCCNAVCGEDDFCCRDSWDDNCVSLATAMCDGSPPPPGGGGGGPGGGGGTCGNNIVDPGEDCDPPDGTLCSSICRFICGNGILQGNEQCEPPNTAMCDAQCRWIVDNPVISPQGDWWSNQYILNSATGLLAFNSPETYRLDASGNLMTAFVSPNVSQIQTQIGGSVTVLNAAIPLGMMVDVFRISFGSFGTVTFRAKIDAFNLAINSTDQTTTWTFDYTVSVAIADPLFGDYTVSARLQGSQTGTVGGDPSQIVWTTITGADTYCDESFTCELCTDFGGTCDADECCVVPLDTTIIIPGTWIRSGG